MNHLYNEDYFERGYQSRLSLYQNYRWMPEMTIRMVYAIIEYLDIKSTDKILDYGCAKGYVVKAFRILFKNAMGCDISEYAVSNADTDTKPYLKLSENGMIPFDIKFDWIISKDTLEHISYYDIDRVLYQISQLTDSLFAIIPLGENRSYRIPAYELDVTHIIKENETWWTNKIQSAGFNSVKLVHRVLVIKDNWNNYPDGNAFIIAKKS